MPVNRVINDFATNTHRVADNMSNSLKESPIVKLIADITGITRSVVGHGEVAREAYRGLHAAPESFAYTF